jgi:ABC-type phosphate transport system substrate-binding protein
MAGPRALMRARLALERLWEDALRILKSLVAVSAAAAAATTLAMAPALADPINSHGKGVTPAPYDIVGVGSESISYIVDQLTYNYNLTVKHHSPTDPYIYSWDAVPQFNLNDTTQQIFLKSGCKKGLRPDGSSAGITALSTGSYGTTSYKGKTYPCVNFARSSRPRKSTDAPCATSGVCFVTLAGDAVTYASTNLKGETTNVPSNLTTAQLKEIFGCTIPAAHGFLANTWGALLGSKAKGASDATDPIVPQAGSGTLSFWMETALGFTTDTEPTCGTAASLTTPQQPEENEGVSKVFLLKNGKPNPNVIYPFSIGAFVAQAYYNRPCYQKLPKKGQDKFGCDERGVFGLNKINGLAPITVKKGVGATNTAWNSTIFHRFLYDVVPYASTADHIPSNLEKYFGKKGYFCKNSSVLKSYGFEATVACGVTS